MLYAALVAAWRKQKKKKKKNEVNVNVTSQWSISFPNDRASGRSSRHTSIATPSLLRVCYMTPVKDPSLRGPTMLWRYVLRKYVQYKEFQNCTQYMNLTCTRR